MLYINATTMRRVGLLDASALGDIWARLEDGLIAVGEGRAHLPLDAYLRSPRPEQFDRIIAKTGVVDDIAGLKWIASAPLNTDKGLPRANGLLILNDIVTGLPYAILDAVPISNLRTAGCSMIFLTRFRPGFRRAVILGAGVHGRVHLDQLLAARDAGRLPALDEIAVFDLDPAASRAFAAEYTCDLTVLDRLADVPGEQTAVLHCTNALEPFMGPELVEKYAGLTGNHMSLRDYTAAAMGAFDHVVADSARHVARASTSVDLAVQAGVLDLASITELPRLLIDARAGHPPPFAADQRVVFNPMGLGSHDLVLGHMVAERVRAAGLGVELAV